MNVCDFMISPSASEGALRECASWLELAFKFCWLERKV